jgi:plastocyanin
MSLGVNRRGVLVSSLLLAVAAWPACGGGGSSSPTSPSGGAGGTPTADVVIVINGMLGANSFSPPNATVKVGQTVAWSNGGSIAHSIAPDGAGGFTTGIINGGTTSTPITITTAGSFPYHCTIHPTMTGTLTAQ